MGGLLALMALCLFTGFCWLISGWLIRNKSKKYYGIKRGIVFLIPALAPVYIQMVEYVLFQQACKEAVVYFPDNKHELPDTLITIRSNKKNKGRYFDGLFKYIVSPHYSNNRPIDLERTKKQFNDYIVYPYKLPALEGENRSLILNDIRYVLVHEPAKEWNNWYSYRTDIYIYDFKNKNKISQLIEVMPQHYGGSLLGYFHTTFNKCPNNSDFNFSYNDIIKHTFIMENK